MPEPSAEVDELAHRVIGVALEVHRVLGPGFVEQAYQRAMEIELDARRIPFASQVPFPLQYKSHSLDTVFRVDLIVDRLLLVELKAVDGIDAAHVAQVIAYLRASQLPLGLLLNFDSALLRNGIRRVLPPRGPRC